MSLYYVKNKKQSWYGESIGILILNSAYPCIPGNVGNASTFKFPVRYKVVKEATSERFFLQQDKELIGAFIDAALELQDEGVKAITGACGFMAMFQKEVADALSIPVFLTSLLQIPFIYNITNKKIGIISADGSRLTSNYFTSIGITDDIPIVIAGMENKKHFMEAIPYEKGILNSKAIEQEVIDTTKNLVFNNNDVGSILFECSDLPPYASTVQKEIDLPIFDYITMIQYVHSALVRSEYIGFM